MKKTITILFAIVLVAAMVLCIVACDNTPITPDDGKTPCVHVDADNNGKCDLCGKDMGSNPSGGGNTPTTPVFLTVSVNKASLSEGETITITTQVTGSDNTAVTYTVSHPEILQVSAEGVVSIKATPATTTDVTITVTTVADPTVSNAKTIRVYKKNVEGSVGDLTSAMIAELGNASITATGTVQDVYMHYNDASQNSVNSYDTLVKMEEGKWMGQWNITGRNMKNIEYFAKDADSELVKYIETTPEGGTTQLMGHRVNNLYISKDNTPIAVPLKIDNETYAAWEGRHMWNHLGDLDVTKFTYDDDNDRYVYTIDPTSFAECLFTTYFSYSLTPMMDDTLLSLYVTIKDGHIDTMVAESEKLFFVDGYQTYDSKEADAMSYTILTLHFSDIGTTVVGAPAPYGETENGDLLAQALASMNNARNYTFRTTDQSTRAPSFDAGEYTTDATLGNGAMRYKAPVSGAATYRNSVSSTGTVGSVGYVTDEGVIIGVTGKYNSSLDGKDYHTEYEGYHPNGDGTYDTFVYSTAAGAFVGQRQYKGDIFFDVMPSFQLSANIFEWDSMAKNKETGLREHTFILRDFVTLVPVVLEMSNYKYAVDAVSSVTDGGVSVVVDENGKLISIDYAYAFVGGTFAGTCHTTFSNIGTTTIAEGAFDGYVRRDVPTSWAQYTDGGYYFKHSTLCSQYGCRDEVTGVYDHSAHTATEEAVLTAIFGESEYANVPTPAMFVEVFGDTINCPQGFDWKEIADGEYSEYIDFNASILYYDTDENYYQTTVDKLKEVFFREGYELDAANTGSTPTGTYRYITFTKGDVQVVIESNHTKFFFISIYRLGDWTLN